MTNTIRRRPRASAVANRSLILDAALTVFAAYGYEGTTTRAIAKQARLQPGHLAKYFSSKEALWQSVIKEFNGEIERILDDRVGAGNSRRPTRIARTVLPKFLRFFAVNHRLTRLMLQEFSISSPRHDWVVQEVGLPLWRRLQPLFEALESRRTQRQRNAAFSYFALLGSALVFFGSSTEVRTIAGLDPHDPATIDDYINHLVSGVLRG